MVSISLEVATLSAFAKELYVAEYQTAFMRTEALIVELSNLKMHGMMCIKC